MDQGSPPSWPSVRGCCVSAQEEHKTVKRVAFRPETSGYAK